MTIRKKGNRYLAYIYMNKYLYVGSYEYEEEAEDRAWDAEKIKQDYMDGLLLEEEALEKIKALRPKRIAPKYSCGRYKDEYIISVNSKQIFRASNKADYDKAIEILDSIKARGTDLINEFKLQYRIYKRNKIRVYRNGKGWNIHKGGRYIDYLEDKKEIKDKYGFDV